MVELPSGVITVLLTDIEGSSQLWEQQAEATDAALARHDTLIRQGVAKHHGHLVKSRGEGDSHFAVFAQASDALAAAHAIQRALVAEPWPTPQPVLVRLALHSGEVVSRDGDYFGPTINRAARLRGLAHGGQVLLSHSTQQLSADHGPPGVEFRDLGAYSLRDLARPERIFQLVAEGLPAEFPPLRARLGFATNLPMPATSLIGRETAVAEVKGLVAHHRVVTLTGIGGSGKTRLALQAATELLDQFPGGVWFIELAPLSDPSLVVQTVANVLGVRAEANRPLTETLVDGLRARDRLLLVLDNCEHVIDASASLVEALLRCCDNARVLTTSREALNVGGERVYQVAPLTVPNLTGGANRGVDPDRLAPPDWLAAARQSTAGRLFVERATAAQPRFALTTVNAPAVGEICRRLDGLPLAIELAAARVRAMSVEQVAARLDDRFRLLTGGLRTAMRRQQTLEAAITWSHDLLSEPERVLLRRLAVFAGGWTLAAAETVCADAALARVDVLDRLTSLVEKSLVQLDPTDETSESRYRLLDTVRQYGLDKLLAANEASALRDRHLDFFADLAQAATEAGQDFALTTGVESVGWVDRVEQEHENCRLALEWGLGDSAAGETPRGQAAVRLADGLLGLWLSRGYLVEGRDWLNRALAVTPTDGLPRLRCRLQLGLAWLTWATGDFVKARAYAEHGLALAEPLGDRFLLGRCLTVLGWVDSAVGRLDEAEVRYAAAIAEFRQAETPVWLAYGLTALSGCAFLRGRATSAATAANESLAIAQSIQAENLEALALARVAALHYGAGRLAEAERVLDQSFERHRQVKDQWSANNRLTMLGRVTQLRGAYDRAAERIAEARRAFAQMGATTLARLGAINLGYLSLCRGDLTRAAELMRDHQALPDARYVAGCVGGLAQLQGRLAEARQHYQSILAAQPRDNGWYSFAVLPIEARLASVLLQQGESQLALDLISLAFQPVLRMVDRLGLAQVLARAATVMAVVEPTDLAARMAGAATQALATMGYHLDPVDHLDLDPPLAALRRRLGAVAYDTAWQAGSELSLEAAVAEAQRWLDARVACVSHHFRPS